MHICHICPYDLSVPGGVRTHIQDLCLTLKDAGNRVTVIGSANGRSHGLNLPVLELGRGGRVPLWGTAIDLIRADDQSVMAFRLFLENESPAVLHFHTPWTPFLSWQLLHTVRKLPPGDRPKLVATFHDSPPETLFGRFLGRFVMPVAARFILPLFDEVISVSDVQRSFISRYSSKNVYVIPNGYRFESNSVLSDDQNLNIEPDRENQTNPGVTAESSFSADSISAEPNLTTDTVKQEPDSYTSNDALLSNISYSNELHNQREQALTMLFLGRLEPRKGLLHAIKAYHRIQTRFPNLKLLIAGAGKSELAGRRYVHRNRLEKVEFLGAVSESDKQRLFKEADVYVSPALYGESFGIVLLEAMAAGTAVAGYGNRGYLSVVGEDLDENFPPPGDLTALSARLDAILSDEIYRAKLIERGYACARRYDWRRIAKEIVALYKS